MKVIVTDSSNFKHLRGKNAYYVDKTKEIVEFFDLNNDIILLPRPRRFGKTLFLSTIYYLFSNKEKDHTLFEDTSIYNTDFFKEHFGKYPVISLTFKDVKEDNFQDMLEATKSEINSIVQKLMEDIDLDTITDSEEKRIIKNILNNKAKKTDYEKSLKALTVVLTSHYKTP